MEIAAAQKPFLRVETIANSDEVTVLSLPGRVTFRPQTQSAIGATAAGRVVAVLVRAGEKVKAGAPLITIESADAAATRATLDQSSTRLVAAENGYRRNTEMMERGVGLEIERAEAEARLKEARSENERARYAANLMGGGRGALVSVRAPVAGVVVSVRATVGATVVPGGEALIELGDPSRLQVVAQVAEGDLGRLSVGQDAEVELTALAARIGAKLDSFNPRVEPESRRAQAYFALKDGRDGVRAGMMAQVHVKSTGAPGIVLPVTAVLIKDGRRRVVYVERPDGSYEQREVETGRNHEGQVAILKGLVPGERVVVRGALLLDNQAEQLL